MPICCCMNEVLASPLGTEVSISRAIESAFEVLGPVSKQRLFERLRNIYGIEIRSARPSNLEGIKRAIMDLFGQNAASLLMNIVYAEIDKV